MQLQLQLQLTLETKEISERAEGYSWRDHREVDAGTVEEKIETATETEYELVKQKAAETVSDTMAGETQEP